MIVSNKQGCGKEAEVEYLGDLPIDTLESTPDFFLTERVVEDPNTGNDVHAITRTPGAKLFPSGNMDNVFVLEANNNDLIETINNAKHEVRAIRLVNEGASNTLYLANAEHKAMMLAIGTLGTGVLCQRCGVINITEGHEYIVGLTYYVGEDGTPTTDSASGQKLFIPVSTTKLLIVM